MRILWLGAIALVVLVVGVGFVGYTGYQIYQEGLLPVDPTNGEAVLFQVRPGMTTGDVAESLVSEQLIRDARVFRWVSRSQDKDGKIQAGWYEINPALTPEEILDKLVSGQVARRRFTIPEGLTVEQTVGVLVRQGMGDGDVFRELLTRRSWVERWLPEGYPEEYPPAEGYLFPETYFVAIDANEESILRDIFDRVAAFWTLERRNQADLLGLSIHEVMTLASIVEREAVLDDERTTIAGVFHNRLGIQMRLEACATVRYALDKPEGDLTTRDTEVDSPYNTYQREGLPPGPIASPGPASLQATLFPEEVPYFFFLARGDGSHVFAETYAEHLRYKAQYID